MTRTTLLASSILTLLATACSGAPTEETSDEAEQRINPHGTAGKAAIVVAAPANVPPGFPSLSSLKPRYSAGTTSGPLTLGEPKTVAAGPVCVTIDKSGRSYCTTLAAGSTTTITIGGIDLQVDDVPSGTTLLGPTEVRPTLATSVTTSSLTPYGAFSFDGKSGGLSSGKQLVLPGKYAATYVDGSFEMRTVAPGEIVSWHPALLARGTIRVEFDPAELPTRADIGKATLAWVPEPTKALAMGDLDGFVQAALDASDTNWSILAGYPGRATNDPNPGGYSVVERVTVTPGKNVVSVLPGAKTGGRYFFVNGSKAIEVRPTRGTETVIKLGRIDVSNPTVDITGPNGPSTQSVKGTFYVHRKTSAGEAPVGTPYIDSMGGAAYRHVEADAIPTGSGLHLLPGDYRIEVRYFWGNEQRKQSYDVSL